MAYSNTLPQPFEMSYFKDRTLKVAALQRQGYILVSGSPSDRGQGYPLPYIHDIPNLRRGKYPYDLECDWGSFKIEHDLGVYRFVPHDGSFPPGWEAFDLMTPIQPVTAVIDRSYRLATVNAGDSEIVLTDVPVEENLYSLLYQVNAILAKSHQPFVVWRLEWVAGETECLWPDQIPQIKNEHGAAYVTGYAHDEAGNLIYLGMVGHKTVLDSIRATVQTRQSKRQRQKLFLQGRPVYAFRSHYCQTWQHLPDFGAYHAVLIADSALPGKWKPGEDAAYMLIFDGNLADGENPEDHTCLTLSSRLSESLPLPIMQDWSEHLWKAGKDQQLVTELETGGDCYAGYWIGLNEAAWVEILSRLLKEGFIKITGSH
jgi:hypothetical protein